MSKKIFIAPYVRDPVQELEVCDLSRPRTNGGASAWSRFVDALRRWLGGDGGLDSPRRRPDVDHGGGMHPVRRQPTPRAYRVLNYATHNVPEEAAIAVGRSHATDTAVEYLMLEAIAPEQLRPSDFLLVETGEWILADGLIIEGEALIDASAATGESAAVVRSADGVREVMRYTQVIAGRIFVEITPRLGHPLDWQAE